MAVFKRKSGKGETEEYHYRFMQDRRLNYGVCEGCTTERKAKDYEKDKRTLAKGMAERKSDAEDFDKYREKVITGEKRILLVDGFDEFMKKPRDREPGKKRLVANRTYFNDFTAFMADKYPEITSLRAVTTKHAEEYINLLKTTGAFSKGIKYISNHAKKPKEKFYLSKATKLSSATVNARHKLLKSVFVRLKKDLGVIHNPFDFCFMESDKEDREVFSEKELRVIGKNMTMPYIKPIFIIGICTGLSLSDICLLKWIEINLKGRVIENKRRRKTGTKLQIPILPPLQTFLQEQNLLSGHCEFVCPELAEMYLNNPTGVNYRIKTFLESLGIKTTINVENRTRAVSNKSVHALRHTFAYMAGVYNIPLAIVQSILGHMSKDMTDMYQRHADLKDKQHYFAKLPIALLGDIKIEPEREQLAELSKTADIKKIKQAIKLLTT